MKRFQDNWEAQLNSCMDLFESLIKDNPEEDAKFYVLNVVIALYAGYKIPPFEIESMYSVVKLTGIPVSQPDIVLSNESKEILNALANSYDWSKITPMFISTLGENMVDPEKRRQGGMHYTSIENIHKLIDPLFLDDLTAEVEEVEKSNDLEAAKALQKKLASLKFLDPASGGGNFLVESYMCLRELENRLIRIIYKGVSNEELGRNS